MHAGKKLEVYGVLLSQDWPLDLQQAKGWMLYGYLSQCSWAQMKFYAIIVVFFPLFTHRIEKCFFVPLVLEIGESLYPGVGFYEKELLNQSYEYGRICSAGGTMPTETRQLLTRRVGTQQVKQKLSHTCLHTESTNHLPFAIKSNI